MKTSFGSVLADLRKQVGKMTQQQLAEKLGVERGAVANYESKSKLPHLETLIKIADLFNVSLDYLVGREIRPEPPRPVSSLTKYNEEYYSGTQLKILPIVMNKEDEERIT